MPVEIELREFCQIVGGTLQFLMDLSDFSNVIICPMECGEARSYGLNGFSCLDQRIESHPGTAKEQIERTRHRLQCGPSDCRDAVAACRRDYQAFGLQHA